MLSMTHVKYDLNEPNVTSCQDWPKYDVMLSMTHVKYDLIKPNVTSRQDWPKYDVMLSKIEMNQMWRHVKIDQNMISC